MNGDFINIDHKMTLQLIKYHFFNKTIRSILLLFFILCALLGVFLNDMQHYSTFILIFFFIYLCSKFLLIPYKIIGTITFEDNRIIMHEYSINNIILNISSIEGIVFYKSGYKNEHYNTTITSTGLLAFKSGINKIMFIGNEEANIVKLLLIKNEEELSRLKNQMNIYLRNGINIVYKNFREFEI